jgi:hypothetical protein
MEMALGAAGLNSRESPRELADYDVVHYWCSVQEIANSTVMKLETHNWTLEPDVN